MSCHRGEAGQRMDGPRHDGEQRLIRRVLARVKVTDAGYDTPCWLSTRAIGTNGYTHIKMPDRRNRLLHRVAFELFVGPIPDGLTIDHLCRNKTCVNPDHLEPVTQRVNQLRSDSPAALRARQTHCIHGHEFTDENTIIKRNGCRQCRACSAQRRAA